MLQYCLSQAFYRVRRYREDAFTKMLRAEAASNMFWEGEFQQYCGIILNMDEEIGLKQGWRQVIILEESVFDL